MSNHTQDEAEIRNKGNKEGDSLAEIKKMENGVDIEPEADEWVAKPAESSHPDPLPDNLE
ncbi:MULTISPECIES: hypothetical protein [unclassified Paenibacillus]|uniref:hypothetical protein n=1 Tax=unclassified Paenibacillus TaxID=185978 RepID=UPI00247482C1|nr:MULTISPECIES: hypothetical protein [unclassified Paenibacillus]MDH6426636.1 hypothetical protein [Paenibacillus sp. PastH-4]MDH6442660.1 hypothetical protein [Paenibacillus sp. PastF-4]MDH6526628.1 hypothetical protein [Paenibacillus sp. PastH-3]